MSVKGASSSSSSGSGQSKKNWKTKRNKWEDKPNSGGKQNWKNENWRNDQNKGTCKHCNKLYYGECWFKDKFKCHRCSKFGQISRNCTRNIQNKSGPIAHFAKNQASERTNMFYASHSLSKPTDFGVWYVDSRCSNHMTSHESLLSNIDRSLKCKMKIGIGELVQASGKRTHVIELKNGPRYIQEVMIVLGLDENLLSVGQMIEHGYWLLFGDSMVNIYANRELKELVANVSMKGNRCFPMKFEFMNLVIANRAAVG
ncbi:uncharacterized protein LOC109947243 [Prunus persica]|uniref:uncharacterized protein LOC109947243 n=1 Tax=Prunus persica TaxID=3760 RepID=UPI0009AB5C62|nr:uncharacterized protein LOC109947243 [Prunus persica]